MKQNRNVGELMDEGFTGRLDMPSPLSRAGLAKFAMCLFFSGVHGVVSTANDLIFCTGHRGYD